MSTNDKTLYYLDELPGYKVASGDCDVRGWTVRDATGRTIGKVDGLLVNKTAERVIYLDVEVNQALIEEGIQTYGTPTDQGMYAFLNQDGDDHLIVPVGMAKLDEENSQVFTPAINFNTFATTGRFTKGMTIERAYEVSILRHYTPDTVVDGPTDTVHAFYDRREFDHTLWRRK